MRGEHDGLVGTGIPRCQLKVFIQSNLIGLTQNQL